MQVHKAPRSKRKPGPPSKRPEPTATERAVACLSRRALSEAELCRRLSPAYSSEQVEAAVRRMGELGLINDQNLAERLARDGFERLGHGPLRMVATLRRRGLDRELAERVAASTADDQAQRSRARELLKRFKERCPGRPPTAESTFRYLLGRGYPTELVRDILDISL